MHSRALHRPRCQRRGGCRRTAALAAGRAARVSADDASAGSRWPQRQALAGRAVCAAALLWLAAGLATADVAQAGATPAEATAATPPPGLHIYTWNGYIDPQIAAEFGRRHGIVVRQSFFASDRERDLRLAAGGAADFDVVLLDAPQVSAYRKRGLIEPIGVEHLPNLALIDARWRDFSAATATHAVPYAWGTIGIIYRADLLARPPDSWLDLFRPAAGLCGRVYAFDDARELIATALKASGHSANATDGAAYQQAEALLRAQRPCVARYATDFSSTELERTDTDMLAAMSYSTDAGLVHARHPNIRYVLPREGALLWADYLVVPAASRRKALAFEFLSYLSDPALAARQAQYNRTAPASESARARLPAALRDDAMLYPDGKDLRAAEMIREAPPAVVARRNLAYARLMRPD